MCMYISFRTFLRMRKLKNYQSLVKSIILQIIPSRAMNNFKSPEKRKYFGEIFMLEIRTILQFY